MSARGKEFADLVHQVTVMEKRYRLEAIAPSMGLSYDALHARVHNRVSFTAEEIRHLIAVAPDPRFVTYLLRGTRYVAAERPEAVDEPVPDAVLRGATRIVIEATDVLEAVEFALGDGRIDHRDGLAILKEIEIAERALASLRTRINDAAPPADTMLR